MNTQYMQTLNNPKRCVWHYSAEHLKIEASKDKGQFWPMKFHDIINGVLSTA